MRILTALPGPVVFAGFLIWFLGWTLLATVLVDLTVPVADEVSLAEVAGPLVPALGAMFAFLTAFAINTEWVQLRDAQHAAEMEADAAARVALVAGSPGLDPARLRGLLEQYLSHVVVDEWPRLRSAGGSHGARDALARISREARAIVAEPRVDPVTGTDLLGAVDALVSLRRDRLSLAGRSMPPALMLLAFVSGVVLCIDALLVALPHSQWITVTVGGVVVVTALALALIVAVSAPYRGTISVDAHPLEVVLEALRRGDPDLVGPP